MVLMLSVIAADAAAPRLGIYGEAHEGGCLVTKVVPGSAANLAGLQVGDVVTSLDGQPVADMRMLTQAVAQQTRGPKGRDRIQPGRKGPARRRRLAIVEGVNNVAGPRGIQRCGHH